MYEEYYHLHGYTGEKYPVSIYHDNEELKVIPGNDVKRVDASCKVLGQGLFSNDVALPQMSYLVFKMCPYAHATVKSIDTSKAKALPGVLAVYTHEDIPNLMVRPPDRYVLMVDVAIQGDPVAAVVADEEDIAEEACALIDVEYEVLPFVLYPENAMKDDYIVRGETNEVGEPVIHIRGDVDAGFDEADEIVEAEYESINNYGGTVGRSVADMEGEAITAVWQEGRALIWPSTQGVFQARASTAAVLGVPHNKVRAVATLPGVGFGLKGQMGRGYALAAYAAKQLNRPVKFRANCDLHFSTQSLQTPPNTTMKVGVKNDGTLTAISDIAYGDGGNWGGRLASSGQSIIRRYFTCPNLYTEARDFITNNNSPGVPRCVHHPRAAMPISLHFDRVPEAIDMNPADFLLKNVFTGSGLGTDQDNPEYDLGSNPMPGLLEKLIEVSGFRTKWKGWKTPMSVDGPKQRGIGIAIHQCGHGTLSMPEHAVIKVSSDGTFQVNSGSQDHGQGFRTAMALIAAEELGVPAASVETAQIDTDMSAESCGAWGSLATRSSGTAVILAAREVKEQLFKHAIAGGLINADKPEDLETADGFIYLKADPGTRVPIAAVTGGMSYRYISDTEGGIISGRGSHATRGLQHMGWGCTVAEVEVDTDTGEVTVLNTWLTHGAGRTIWQTGAHNQALGALTMSMGRALMEGLVRDNGSGIALSPNYLEYRLPTHMDIPNQEIEFVNEIDPYGPFGCKGVAEPLLDAPAPAIGNAIYNACGARVNNTPITPDKILVALGKA